MTGLRFVLDAAKAAARLFLISCGAVLLLAPATLADSVVVEALKDNTLYENDSGDISNGIGDYFFAGRTKGGELRRATIAFDVGAVIPAGSTIHDVTLTLYMSRTIVGSRTVSLHLALADWGEGNSDAPDEEGTGTSAEPGDATWLHTFYPNAFWAASGGDFLPTPRASTSVNQNGFYNWNAPSMMTDVQDWLDDPGSNYGWILIGEEVGTSAKRFDSRQNPNAGRRPQLTVDFTSPPALALTITGQCPGAVDVSVTGAIPNGSVALAWSPAEGSFIIPGGGCAGTQIDLDAPRLLTVVSADAGGEVTLTRNAPAQACGAYLQSLDLTTCRRSNVARVPL